MEVSLKLEVISVEDYGGTDMLRRLILLCWMLTGCTVDVESAASFSAPTVTLRARTVAECAEAAPLLTDVIGVWSSHEGIYLDDGGCVVDPDGPDVAVVSKLPTTYRDLEIHVVDQIVESSGATYGGWLQRNAPCEAGAAIRDLHDVVLAHEIGHWLGLRHVHASTNLMHRRGSTLHVEDWQAERVADDLRRRAVDCP